MNKTYVIKTTLIAIITMNSFACSLLKKVEEKKNEFEPTEPVVVLRPREETGAIYQEHIQTGLFDDLNAKNIGDVITIVINENTTAAMKANTSATKDNTVDLPSPKLAGETVTKDGKEIMNNEFTGDREFNGQGNSQQNSNMTGILSVTVAKVLPNRNLVVKGEKLVTLNQAEEFIRFSGIIRPQDIAPDNTVESTRVADVRVIYSGDGPISEANKMGVLGRFFQGRTWPY